MTKEEIKFIAQKCNITEKAFIQYLEDWEDEQDLKRLDKIMEDIKSGKTKTISHKKIMATIDKRLAEL